MKKILTTLLMLVFITGVTACATTEPNLPDDARSTQQIGPSVLVESYKMAVGDQLQINVWKNPELSLSTPVRPDGKISVPLIGDVMAVGVTPEELALDIETKLSDYIKRPNVTVILTGLHGHAFLSRIRVTGSVVNNISMPYHQGMTVLDAILEAGSVDLFANANRTKLHRRTETGTVAYDIRLKDILEKGDMTTNIILLPGDVITVPQSTF